MEEWRSAITIWKAGIAQLESKHAAVDHVYWCSGLQNWDWRKRRCVHVTSFDGIDWIDRMQDWRVLWWLSSTAQKRVQSEVEGKRREFSGNGTCTTWCRVLRFPDRKQQTSQYYNQSSWKGEKVYWSTFSGGSVCEKEIERSSESRRREGICHCDVPSNQILSRDLWPKRIATEFTRNQQRESCE